MPSGKHQVSEDRRNAGKTRRADGHARRPEKDPGGGAGGQKNDRRWRSHLLSLFRGSFWKLGGLCSKSPVGLQPAGCPTQGIPARVSTSAPATRWLNDGKTHGVGVEQ